MKKIFMLPVLLIFGCTNHLTPIEQPPSYKTVSEDKIVAKMHELEKVIDRLEQNPNDKKLLKKGNELVEEIADMLPPLQFQDK